MCGRYTMTLSEMKLAARFHAGFSIRENWRGKYNAAPSMMLPIVISANSAGIGGKQVVLARWGLERLTSADSEVMGLPQPNARLETTKSKPTFRDAFKSRHCLIPAESYFEWLRSSKFKQPYRIMRNDNAVFAMAGVWNHPATARESQTFAVLTTEPNPLIRKIHERMPVILQRKQEDM
jgi:putative SOS response-associated peptidase YedK